MSPEEEMYLCFIKAGVIFRSLSFCAMGTSDTKAAFDEFFALANEIRSFIERATGKTGDIIADLAMNLIQDEGRAAAFVRENLAALLS